MATTYSSPIGSIVKWKGTNDVSPFANDCAEDFSLCLPVVNNTDLAFVIDMLGSTWGEFNYNVRSSYKVYKCDDCGDLIPVNYSTPYEYSDSDNRTVHLIVTDFSTVSFAYIAVDTCFKMCLEATRPTVYRYLANSNPANGAIADAFYIGATRYDFVTSYTCTGVAATDWPIILARIEAVMNNVVGGYYQYTYVGGSPVIYLFSTGQTLILNITTVGVDITWTELASVPGSTEVVACSNCFIKSDDECFTTLLEYRSDDDCFGFEYSVNAQMQAFTNKVRIPAYLKNMQMDSEENVYRNSNGTVQLVSASYQQQWDFETDFIYREWIEAIALALKHDTVTVTNDYSKLTSQQIVSTEKPEIVYSFEPFMSMGNLKAKVTITPYDQRNSNCG